MKVVIFLYKKFFKLLKTDTNTFVGYILTLLSIYFSLDRLCEIVLLISKGIGVSYWGPFMYTFALACPVFGFLIMAESSFNKYRTDKGKTSKLRFLYLFAILFTILLTSMIMQYVNLFAWSFVVGLKNFYYVARVFPELFKPAFSSAVAIIPIFLIAPLVTWFINMINDNPDSLKSIRDFEGLKLTSSKSEATGPYTCEVVMFRSTDKKKDVTVPEMKRFEGSLFVGPTGSGKTRTLIDPMVAFDMEKKYFFKEMGKQIAYTALNSGVAQLNSPYSNDYLNDNFRMDMLSPMPGKIEEYKKCVKKLIHFCDKDNNITYKNLGITLLTNDADSLNVLSKVATNYNIRPNIVDPFNPDSIGINPFALTSPTEIGLVISTVLDTMFVKSREDLDTFYATVSRQALENLAILLKVMYPRLNNGKLPSLEDLLHMLNNFNLVEKMCEKMKEDDELAEKYALQISYFEKNFYKPPVSMEDEDTLSFIGSGRAETQKYLYNTATELDNVLRHPGVRNILCNKTNNIDFDKMFKDGEVTLVSLVKQNLPFRTLGMFFLNQYSVSLYRRQMLPDESLIGNFFYIDDLTPYLHPITQGLFTSFRRGRCGLSVCIHGLSELEVVGAKTYRDVVLTNCKTKVVFGDTSPEDTEYWVKEFGTTKQYVYKLDWKPGHEEESPTRKDFDWTEKAKYSQEKIVQQAFRQVKYKTKDAKGKTERGGGETDFLNDRHKKSHESKKIDFEKFIAAISKQEENKNKNSAPVDDADVDPIIQDKYDASDPDTEDAITIPLEDKKNKSESKK